MNPVIDQMLGLTADIAEELLLIKDAGRADLPDGLKLKIISLAELAATTTDEACNYGDEKTHEEECREEPDQQSRKQPEEEIPCSHHGESDSDEADIAMIAESAEYEEKADADIVTDDVSDNSISDDDTMEEVSGILEPEPDTDEEVSVGTPCSSPMENHLSESGCDSQVSVDGEEFYHVNPGELQRSFSINDAFLFRREIFGGSKSDFIRSLDHIARLTDREALKEYLVGSLRLNLNESPGKEFYQALMVFFK